MSLKSEDITTTANNFETRTIRTVELSSYVWNMKKTKKETPTLVWEIIPTTAPYTNITKWCSLCLLEKLAILLYPSQSELLNKRLELVSVLA